MYVRLAFSVAAHLEPDILILDEVLAVGDAAFQKKCMNKILSVASEGKTILFVSHSMGSVNELCDRALLLQKGKIKLLGTTEAVTDKYMESDLSPAERQALLLEKKEKEREKENADSPPPGVIDFDGTVQVRAAKHVFSDFRINGKSIQQKIIVSSGSKITIETNYVNDGMSRDLLIGFAIKNLSNGEFPVYVHNKLEKAAHQTNKSGSIKAELEVPKLAPGEYALEANIWLDDKMFVENEPVGKFRILEVPTFKSKQTFSSFPSSVLVDSVWSFK
jgi:ABC-type glutathione transport system ATPase component